MASNTAEVKINTSDCEITGSNARVRLFNQTGNIDKIRRQHIAFHDTVTTGLLLRYLRADVA